MAEHALLGRRIAVIEDEYFIAYELASELEKAGATVLGPFGSVGQAMASVTTESRIDCAILDINLNGEMVFPFADALARRHIPFLFATGYDAAVIPARFRGVEHHEKPICPDQVIKAIQAALQD